MAALPKRGMNVERMRLKRRLSGVLNTLYRFRVIGPASVRIGTVHTIGPVTVCTGWCSCTSPRLRDSSATMTG